MQEMNGINNDMQKKTLIIGSAVADITIRVDHLPGLEEDVNPYSQTMHLGGCAYNTANMFRLMKEPFDLCAPVGTGIYGDFVRRKLEEKGVRILFDSPDENGCCYCIVDEQGRRTFLSVHGAEYRFEKKWFDRLDADAYTMGYCCGFELEEDSGEYILDFFRNHPSLPFCYAPGPRIMSVPQDRQEALLDLHPLLHLNLKEARALLRRTKTEPEEMRICAGLLAERTGNTVIITDGANGCGCMENGQWMFVPAEPLDHVIDSTGAGDAHIGTYLACRQKGMCTYDALVQASHIGARVCTVHGAVLEDL
ncbi:MAG: ribokinase [Solobacterium sp.]|nr:ribokinase [Solobacterium sp.]